MDIGSKVRQLRMLHGLTLEELADRTELSKGFLSQLERNLASPSIATLTDILACLGVGLSEFFSDAAERPVVYCAQDIFEKRNDEAGSLIRWLVPHAQSNDMEPILLTLQPGGVSDEHQAHEGEEFGYVTAGSITLQLGHKRHRVRKGESFYYKSNQPHSVRNPGKTPATLLWVACPPSF